MTITRSAIAIYVFLTFLGAGLAWAAAPALESIFFPVFGEVKVISVEREGNDLVCWSRYAHKLRSVANKRWSITIVLADGTRFFSYAIDGRTKASFSTKDQFGAGYKGTASFCTPLPAGFDHSQAFTIESFGQYEPQHHLWIIDQRPVLEIPVPAAFPEGIP